MKGKTNMKGKSLIAVLLLPALLAASSAHAPVLTFHFTALKAPGATMTVAEGINDAGVMTGFYVDKKGLFQGNHGMVLDGQKVTLFDHPRCGKAATQGTQGVSINSAGTVAGWCYTSDNPYQSLGFVWSKGKFTDLKPTPNAVLVAARGINDKGEVVGRYTDSSGLTHGFLWDGKKYTTLDVPNSLYTEADAINNQGLIVLTTLNSAFDAYLYDGKTYKKIDDPNAGTYGTYGYGLNNKGDVVGLYWDANTRAHGWLLHGSKYYNLDYPGSAGGATTSISDSKVIVGYYTPSGCPAGDIRNCVGHGYKATVNQ
jgi:probable HAF family extracellular repeat protein